MLKPSTYNRSRNHSYNKTVEISSESFLQPEFSINIIDFLFGNYISNVGTLRYACKYGHTYFNIVYALVLPLTVLVLCIYNIIYYIILFNQTHIIICLRKVRLA